MSTEVWGSLPKSQTDSETVEEAITRLITAHLADANAHIEAGESLYTHKQSEVIDHLADSIVEDKIGDSEVSLQKLLADHFFILSSFESLDGWDITGTTLLRLGTMRLQTTAISDSYNWTDANTYTFPGLDWTKNFIWQSGVKIHSNADQLVWFGVGGLPPDDAISFAGFKIDDGTLYAYAGDIPISTWLYQETVISGITVTNFHIYRIMYDQTAGTLKFYVDNVLKVTFNSNLPTENDDRFSMYFIKTLTTSIKYLTAVGLLYSREI